MAAAMELFQIGVIAAKHAVNDILGMLVKGLRFCNAVPVVLSGQPRL